MKVIKEKRKYEKKIDRKLEAGKDFLIERLRKEWDEIQKTAKREQLIRQAKAGAGTMAEILLGLLTAAGVVTIAAATPGILVAFDRTIGRRVFFEKKNLNQAKNYLLKRKFIKVNSRNTDEFIVKITPAGVNKVLRKEFKKLRIEKPKKWDGFWRIVIFDIPDRHKGAREGFRNKLKEAGFYQLQESVFITPYPCEEEVQFFISVFGVADYVRFIQTKTVWNDDDLRHYFGL